MSERKKILLRDYTAPQYIIESVNLDFALYDNEAVVKSTLRMRTDSLTPIDHLKLDGEDLELISIEVNGQPLRKELYQIDDKGLTIFEPPSQLTLSTQVKIKPHLNTRLEGLYKSNNTYVTQCEAYGFHRITYFFDRPDVMTIFTVRIEADENQYPVLLSNGNCIERKKLRNGRHQAVWNDPYKKACYLFALVAGNLSYIEDQFTTQSGRSVKLKIYCPAGLEERCRHAMESLKKAMQWDEHRYGREYDLDTYMIVAIDDFNAGAMENKGLNIFNGKLIYADTHSATDEDYFHIESVVGHEYFHNWTGNRVTLRDWFHLSLKEGLTVFRDQEFSMDMSSRDLVRIDSVSDLRNRQFPEDAGPNAHPIRPEYCYAVDNFYTSTIYDKGAEIIRMMQTMVGRPGFRKGMDLYFKRHDGQAVVIEDFAKAISDANQTDWTQFKRWYSQAGTPHVKIKDSYDEKKCTYTLELEQNITNPAVEFKQPLDIPIVIGLLDRNGQEYDLQNSSALKNSEGQYLLRLQEMKQTFQFQSIPSAPVLSFNRQFSAPILVDWNASFEDLIFLTQNDSDSFNRFEASQKILTEVFLHHSTQQDWIKAFRHVLKDEALSLGIKAKILTIPEDSYLLQLTSQFDSEKFLQSRTHLEKYIATELESELLDIYHRYHEFNVHSQNPKDFEHRRLKNTALYYLSQLKEHQTLALHQFENSKNMTDLASSFSIITNLDSTERASAIQRFYDLWKDDNIVINRWFSTQALSRHPDTFSRVQNLWRHPQFNKKNPNRIYSLIRAFTTNLVRFHDPNWDTYSFLADCIIEIDQLNPQAAARVASGFSLWKKQRPELQSRAQEQLQRLTKVSLSANTYEILSRCLG